jgi:hypothetical protein
VVVRRAKEEQELRLELWGKYKLITPTQGDVNVIDYVISGFPRPVNQLDAAIQKEIANKAKCKRGDINQFRRHFRNHLNAIITTPTSQRLALEIGKVLW